MDLPISYRQSARQFFKNVADDEIWTRHVELARRLLSAVCFREHSAATFEKTGSVLLPPIGYYYSLFHMGIAVLALDYTVKMSDLRRMNHSRLQNLITSKLVNRKLLSKAYSEGLEQYRIYREYANYVFGGRSLKDSEFEALEIVPIMYTDTESLFDDSVDLILALSTELCRGRELLIRSNN